MYVYIYIYLSTRCHSSKDLIIISLAQALALHHIITCIIICMIIHILLLILCPAAETAIQLLIWYFES